MNKLHIFLSILIFVYGKTNAQSVKFEKIFGGNDYDYAYSVTQTFDRGYVVAGSTSSQGYGSTDAYVLKTDSLGNVLWQRYFGGINIDRFYSVTETPDSGLVMAGYTNSLGAGGYDMLVVKTNKLGVVEWEKYYGGSNWDFAYSICSTNDGGYAIAGGTYTFGKGNEDFYLVKVDALGDTLWTKTYGGNNEDEAKSIKQTSDGGLIIAGHTKSFGDIESDFYIVKTNDMGDTTWTYTYHGAQADYAYDVIEDNTGSFLVAGKSKSIGNGNFDGLIIKISSAGIAEIMPPYCGDNTGGADDDGFHSICLNQYSRMAVVGYTYSFGWGFGTDDITMYVTNPYNGYQYRSFGGNRKETGHCVKNTHDGGYIICGNSSSYSNNFEHMYLIKTDSNGVSSGNISSVNTFISSKINPKETVKIYPNPANDYFNIDLYSTNNSFSSIEITSITGQVVQVIDINNANDILQVSTQDIENGIYFIQLKKNNEVITGKIIVQH